jgi:O-antigen ligase
MNIQRRNDFPLLFRVFDISVIFFVFALVNINSLARFRQFPEVDNYSDNENSYIFTAIFTMGLIALLLWRNRLFPAYVAAWKKNLLLIVFVVYALASLAWTVYYPATQYKLIFLFFSTLAGSYLAIRYGTRGVIHILIWVGTVFAALSLLIVVYFPLVGVMQNEIFFGSWTGMFWHRNHTGNIFAFFNMVFLLRLLFDERAARSQTVILGLLYLLTAAMVFGSRSATGVIIFLFLHFVIALTFAWLKLHDRIKPWQYYASAGGLLAGFLIFITNTGFFFGLLGRTSTMTGRIPLWEDLFNTFYLQKPFFGFGYGALWMQKKFRIAMQVRHGWDYQVYFADNGFFDILLNLGAVGLLLFLAIYIPIGVRSFKQAVESKHWIKFFPFLTFLYILIGNLTYSFLLEVDQMIWLLLVMMVFLTTPINRDNIPQP